MNLQLNLSLPQEQRGLDKQKFALNPGFFLTLFLGFSTLLLIAPAWARTESEQSPTTRDSASEVEEMTAFQLAGHDPTTDSTIQAQSPASLAENRLPIVTPESAKVPAPKVASTHAVDLLAPNVSFPVEPEIQLQSYGVINFSGNNRQFGYRSIANTTTRFRVAQADQTNLTIASPNSLFVAQTSSDEITPSPGTELPPTPVPPPSYPKKDDWRFEFQPYVFIPLSVSGKFVFGQGANLNIDRLPRLSNLIYNGFQVSAERSLSDIVSNLDQFPIWFAGRFEAWKNNLGFVVQGSYLDVGFKNERQRLDTQMDLRFWTLDALLGWHLATIPLGSPKNQANQSTAVLFPSLSFELFGGIRYIGLHQNVDFSPGPNPQLNRDLIDPLISTRIGLQLSQALTLGVRGDFSGFGVPGGSDFNWDLLMGLDWRITPGFSLRPGYRIYSLTYREDGRFGERGIDLWAHGLWLGAAFHF